MTFGLLLKNSNIGRIMFVPRDFYRAFIFGMVVPSGKAFPMVPLILNVETFDLLLNIGHNFLTARDRAFLFGICVSYVQTFRMKP